jgi:carboxymethylenebutenolidase
MGRTVDYYFAPQSPWAYLGHQRLADIVQRTGAAVRVMPIDLGGKVFPISGGLPLGQRAPQRQAYRLVELQRFSQHLNVPLNLKPQYFPVGGDDAARLIIAADLALGSAGAMAIAGAILTACWAQERNMADDKVLADLLQEQNLPAAGWRNRTARQCRSVTRPAPRPRLTQGYSAHRATCSMAKFFGARTDSTLLSVRWRADLYGTFRRKKWEPRLN